MIGVLTDPAVGGTFLCWTIYYLSGDNEYFSVRHNKVIPLTDNPLTNKNAHNFAVNQIHTSNQILDFVSLVSSHANSILYMHQLNSNTKEGVDAICNNAEKNIVVMLGPKEVLYNSKYESRANIYQSVITDKILSTVDEAYCDFYEHFFKQSKEEWDSQGLNDIWDIREFLALNLDFFDQSNRITKYLPPISDYFYINANDLWINFDQVVHELFVYLGRTINDIRYQKWIDVYKQWQKVHTNRLRFIWYFDDIIEFILQGESFDLTKLNLDVRQEAAIQHVLIYKHGLNLKTWQLTKFINTKQLHDLLETNIHDLSKSKINNKRLTT